LAGYPSPVGSRGGRVTAVSDAARLVLAVARLGEADLAGWWRSHGLDAVGEYVLPELFPRTAAIAGAELAVFSAAKRHADSLPDRDNVVHLFGEPLPAFSEVLALLAELKTGGDLTFLDELRSWSSGEVAHGALERLTGTPPAGERIGATVRLGRVSGDVLEDQDETTSVVRMLAAAYVGQGHDLAIPYFDLA
jgi:hypothetical protein